MFIIQPYQRPAVLIPAASRVDQSRPGDAEWRTWPDNVRTEIVTVDRPAELLDAFTRLARPVGRDAMLSRVDAFAAAFGPWAYCSSGDVHADFDARGLGPVPLSPAKYRERAAREMRSRRRMSPPRGAPSDGGGAQWMPGMLTSAERVNALRGVVAAVMQGGQADPRLWRIVWSSRSRRPFRLGSLEDEVEAARFLVGRWLQAEHVELGVPYGLPADTARVAGVAGALAVALADEFEPRNRVSRCTHRLIDGRCGDLTRADERRAVRCNVTWKPGRRRNDGGLPPHCPTCDNLHRVTVHRITPPSKRVGSRARST